MKRSDRLGRVIGLCMAIALPVSAQAADMQFSAADQVRLAQIESQVSALRGFAQRVEQISGLFLGTPYMANTLIGGPTTPERLVVRFDGVDCYTFIDLVRALSLSNNKETFIEALKNTRYQTGQVTFLKRRHFLTDWVALAPHNARDMTSALSSQVQVTRKMLNRRADGGVYIAGLAVQPRDIAWLPPEALTPSVTSKIKTGDVIGIYTALAGLDVTHTGLAIWKNGVLYFRNASSLKANMKVVDTPLQDYLQHKPGFLVLRMRDAT